MLQNFGGKLLGKSKCQNNEFELWRTEACVLGFCLVWNRKRMNICVTTPNFGKYQPSFFFFLLWSCFSFFLKEVDRPLQFCWNPCCSLFFLIHYAVNEHIHCKLFAIANSATENKIVFTFICRSFSIFKYLGVELLSQGISHLLLCQTLPDCFPKWLYQFLFL